MKRISALLLAILAASTAMFAQQQRNCGSMDVLDRLKQEDPALEQKMQNIETFTQNYVAKHEHENERVVYTIPVVFHVVYKTTTENISDAQIMSQLTVLNNDFRKLNSDAGSVPSAFAGLAADAEINFCLAQTTPTGAATTGITRTYANVSSWGTNDNVKKATQGGVNPWDATKYLNIWICNIGGGILGYAQFPGGSTATDGVVIDYRYLGTTGTATAPFNKGRTATHEVGHYLNLRHIWGDATCGSDLVSDTPTHNTSNYGCPSQPHYSTCSGSPQEMTMNYMDYTDDACMYMFSSGQKTRMQAVLASGGARASLATSTACNAPSGGGGTTCGTPSSLSASAVTSSSATLSWAAVSGATSYNVQYKTSSATTWTTTTSTTNSKSLSGLAASTTYNFQVQAVCSTTSAYSSAASFTTSAATGTSCTDNYESNNTKSTAKSIATNSAITAKIGSSTDVDWFKFSNASTQKNILVELYNLPFDYDLQLYKSNGTLLATSENANTDAESIIYNNATTATYYVKVYGYGGAYSSSSCYNLKASISSTAFRNDGSEENLEALESAPAFENLSIFPNPVQDVLTIDFNTFEISDANVTVYDMYGKEMLRLPVSVNKGSNRVELNMGGIANGVYIVNVQQGTEIRTQKVVVNH